MKSSLIERTGALFRCHVSVFGGEVLINHNGKIAKSYELQDAKSWNIDQWITVFESISGTKQADLWKETR